MFRHSFMLGLLLLAASASRAQSPAQFTPRSIAPVTASALDKETGPLSLPAAISLAFEQNKTLAAARKEIEAADATILQAGARPNPEFSALIEDTRKSSRTTTYQINQPIELGGKRSARIEAAQRARDMAVLDYAAKRSELRAARNGQVTNLRLAQGNYATAGQAVMALVDQQSFYVVAYFEETKLPGIRVGMRAQVRLMSGDQPIDGTVESISPATGAEFSLIPAQNASGNWVKVVQRVPIRLKVEMPADAPALRTGMSAYVEIDTGHQRQIADLFDGARQAVGL